MLENTAVESEETELSYLERNRGFVTASKLKLFEHSPEEYFLKYVKEDGVTFPKPEPKCFTIGTAFDDYLSYGKDKFFDKYKLKVANLLKTKGDYLDFLGIADKSDDFYYMDEKTQKLKPKTVDILKEEVQVIKDADPRIELSQVELTQILASVSEVKRQPLMMERDDGYEDQKEFTLKYGNLTLKATLDRYSKEKKEIRDWKTTGTKDFIKSFRDYGYDMSMAFYWLMAYKNDGVDCDLYLDVLYKSTPSCGLKYIVDKSIVIEAQSRLVGLLDELEDMTNRYNETKDETIWQVNRGDILSMFGSEYWDKMATTVQTEAIIIS